MGENVVLENVLDPRGQPSGIFGRVSDATSKNTGVVLDPYRQPTQDLSSMEGAASGWRRRKSCLSGGNGIPWRQGIHGSGSRMVCAQHADREDRIAQHSGNDLYG
jgi:hypothetical protein